MSNKCYTSYIVTGSPKNISRLDAVLASICKAAAKKVGSAEGACDFETVIDYLGLDRECGRFDLRGDISSIRKDYDSISFNTESAWIPNHAVVNALINSVSEDFNILYTAEEYNEGVYLTNDPTVAGKWVYVFGRDLDEYPEPLRGILGSKDLIESRDLGDALVKSLGHDGNLRHLAIEACRKWGFDLFQYEEEPIC